MTKEELDIAKETIEKHPGYMASIANELLQEVIKQQDIIDSFEAMKEGVTERIEDMSIVSAGLKASEDNLLTQLACACDALNTWARECGITECEKPHIALNLRNSINNLHGWVNSKHHAELSKLDKEITLLQQRVKWCESQMDNHGIYYGQTDILG